MLFDEIGHSRPYRSLERNSFHTLCKIFDGDKDPNVTIQWQMDRADKIKPLGVERPWCAHVLQAHRMGMDEVHMRLTSMAAFNKLSGVPLHRRPIIPHKLKLFVKFFPP